MGGGEREIAPSQTALWGLGRVVALEQPGAWGGLVDLDPGGDEREIEGLTGSFCRGRRKIRSCCVGTGGTRRDW